MSVRPKGGQTLYTSELAAKILTLMADGKSVREICRADEMPAPSTVRLWAVNDVDGFAVRYARAREAQVEHWADEIIEIADDGKNDKVTDENGNERTDWDAIGRSRLRVDTRKWLMSKIAPKNYGDKLQHTGEGGGSVKLEVITGVQRQTEKTE